LGEHSWGKTKDFDNVGNFDWQELISSDLFIVILF
jgi:hypothetical protein